MDWKARFTNTNRILALEIGLLEVLCFVVEEENIAVNEKFWTGYNLDGEGYQDLLSNKLK